MVEDFKDEAKESPWLDQIENNGNVKQQIFSMAVSPLIEYLNNNHHPHTSIIVTTTHAEVLEGKICVNTNEFVKD